MSLCRACQHHTAPTHRGVLLCSGCTRVLLGQLRNPRAGDARVVRSRDYGTSCDLCGEWEGRRILEHPMWGNVCEVDVLEAAAIHGIELA